MVYSEGGNMSNGDISPVIKKRGIGSLRKNKLIDCLPVRDTSRGLIITNNPQNPAHQVDVSAKEIILQDDNFNSFRITEVDLTLDITTNGANGLDSGTESNYRWYYVWIIAKTDGSVAGIFSSSSDNPTIPANYVYRGFAGAVHNCRNSGYDFGPIKQVGNTVARNAVAVINSGTATIPTLMNCSGALPEKAVIAMGDITLNIASGGGRGAGWLRSAPDQGCVEFAGYLDAQGRLTVPFCIPIIETQTLLFNRDSSSHAESITISISGYGF
jgi:hypothetical protein